MVDPQFDISTPESGEHRALKQHEKMTRMGFLCDLRRE